MVAGPEDELKRATCEQSRCGPRMASPVPTPNIWAFHVKSGKPGPWEPSSRLPVRRLRGCRWRRLECSSLPLPLPPPSLGGSDGCRSSHLSLVSYLHPSFCVLLMIGSIGWCLRCRLSGSHPASPSRLWDRAVNRTGLCGVFPMSAFPGQTAAGNGLVNSACPHPTDALMTVTGGCCHSCWSSPTCPPVPEFLATGCSLAPCCSCPQGVGKTKLWAVSWWDRNFIL